MDAHRVIGLSAQCAAFILMAGCSAISAPKLLPEDASVKPVASTEEPTIADPYITFNRALKVAQTSGADVSSRNALLAEGFGLIDYRCGRYFAILGKAEQDLSFDRKQTSLTSGVVLALAGLAKASTRSVSTAGSLFSFAGASMDSYEDVYLFSPDVRLVQDLVVDSMTTYHTAFLNQATAKSDIPMSAVWATLAQYESLCQPASIKNLVNKSVASVQTAAASAPDKVASAADKGASAPEAAASASKAVAVAAAASAASAAAIATSASSAARTAADRATVTAKAARKAAAAAAAASNPAAAVSAVADAKAAQSKALAAARAASSSDLVAKAAVSAAAYANDAAATASAAAAAVAAIAASAPKSVSLQSVGSPLFVQPRIVIEVVPKSPLK